MIDNTLFINEAINEAFNLYNSSKDNKDSLNYNSFMCSIIRMLLLIYDEEIVNCFDKKDVDAFDKEILKYGYSKKEYNNFKLCIDKFYNFDKKIKGKAIKKKNKYFNLTQKYLIDMMVQRNNKEQVDKSILNDFCDLLFTAKSKTFYQKSYAVLVAYNPYEIDEYVKKQKLVGDGNEKESNN